MQYYKEGDKVINSYYDEEELSQIGLKSYGKNVLISRKASIYSPEKISIGNHVRIDDFTILSGEITIGNYIHIGPFCGLFGNCGIEMKDFSGISSRVCIYSASDDFNGDYLTNSPVIPAQFCKTTGAKVVLDKHVNVGTGATIMPGVHLKTGTAIGSMGFVYSNTEEWSIYFGIPVKKIGIRKKNLLLFETKLTEQER